MRTSLAALSYFWPKAAVYNFYAEVCRWPVDIVYLGETVCSKRRELRREDWMSIATQLRAAGKEVVFSSLALIEAESELAALKRWIGEGGCLIEANDMAAVQLCKERQLPFVAGSGLSLYNHEALMHLQRLGMQRWVMGIDQGQAALQAILGAFIAAGIQSPELEVTCYGRLPLAYSARCFTARARQRGKDDCDLSCRLDPEGLRLKTREGKGFLRINGIQVQSDDVQDLGPELPELAAMGIGIARICPDPDTANRIEAFAAAAHANQSLPRNGGINGYWYGQAGLKRYERGA